MEADLNDLSYFAHERREMLSLIPGRVRRVLDVGCASGRFGFLVKRATGAEVWGIEPSQGACQEARNRLDRVIHSEFNELLDLPSASFDVVVFNDVLEHLADPWGSLKFTRTLLAEGGVVVASIPNVRHFPTLWRLVVRKEWRYVVSGTLDRTHLRFFTRQTIEELFLASGYRMNVLEGINPFMNNLSDDGRLWHYFKVLHLLTLGHIRDMKFLQYAIQATPQPCGAEQPD